MTATPIPRTIALTLYGELDMSVIDEMPAGRLPIKTYLTPQHKREDGYNWIKAQIKEHGIQVFIICPLIEESESETMKSVKAAAKEYEHLKDDVFTEFNVGLLHGKLKPKEKDQIMQQFKNKEFDILVATSVVEVGIDVPNATIMIIEGAERFGLAQLHQLRGRIGRGDKQSYCLLFTELPGVNQRLKFFASTTKGIELAEFDLKIRGPGNMFGTQQSGFDSLQIADLSNYNIVSQTGNAAQDFIEKYPLEQFPEIKKRVDKFRIDQIARD
jgi:ATP-dependent DNA helicase RecG